MEELVNHPVHIVDENSISSFIPFCFFGGVPIGKKLVNFQFPVCNLFRKKIVEGKVCYEADVNHHKEDLDNRKFGFIIDTNEEYDAENLIGRKSIQKNKSSHLSSEFKTIESENRFSIFLKTISMY